MLLSNSMAGRTHVEPERSSLVNGDVEDGEVGRVIGNSHEA